MPQPLHKGWRFLNHHQIELNLFICPSYLLISPDGIIFFEPSALLPGINVLKLFFFVIEALLWQTIST